MSIGKIGKQKLGFGFKVSQATRSEARNDGTKNEDMSVPVAGAAFPPPAAVFFFFFLAFFFWDAWKFEKHHSKVRAPSRSCAKKQKTSHRHLGSIRWGLISINLIPRVFLFFLRHLGVRERLRGLLCVGHGVSF
jgi:hypothetical protein